MREVRASGLAATETALAITHPPPTLFSSRMGGSAIPHLTIDAAVASQARARRGRISIADAAESRSGRQTCTGAVIAGSGKIASGRDGRPGHRVDRARSRGSTGRNKGEPGKLVNKVRRRTIFTDTSPKSIYSATYCAQNRRTPGADDYQHMCLTCRTSRPQAGAATRHVPSRLVLPAAQPHTPASEGRSMRNPRWRLALCLAVTATGLVAACGGGTSGTTAPVQASTGEPQAGGTATIMVSS